MNQGMNDEQLKIYQEYEHFIGINDYEDIEITIYRLYIWALDDNRKFICSFCGCEPINHFRLKDFTAKILICPRCKDYKGIIPDICESEIKFMKENNNDVSK